MMNAKLTSSLGFIIYVELNVKYKDWAMLEYLKIVLKISFTKVDKFTQN